MAYRKYKSNSKDKSTALDKGIKLIETANEKVKTFKHKPENVIEYLDFLSQFNQYSARNNLLIQNQRKGAIAVATFPKFKELGYSVNRGESSIQILRPNIYEYFLEPETKKFKPVNKANEVEKQLIANKQIQTISKTTFSQMNVFDVTQTNMPKEEYPKIYPNAHVDFVFNGNNIDNFNEALQHYSKNELNIPVTIENYNDLAKGKYYPLEHRISLNEKNTPTENAHTLIHELAHSKMHNWKNISSKDNALTSTNVKEYQAEMTTYVVAKHFGLDTEEHSINYISSWTDNLNKIEDENLFDIYSEVSNTSKEMVSEISKTIEEISLEKGVNDMSKSENNNVVDIEQQSEITDEQQKTYDIFKTIEFENEVEDMGYKSTEINLEPDLNPKSLDTYAFCLKDPSLDSENDITLFHHRISSLSEDKALDYVVETYGTAILDNPLLKIQYVGKEDSPFNKESISKMYENFPDISDLDLEETEKSSEYYGNQESIKYHILASYYDGKSKEDLIKIYDGRFEEHNITESFTEKLRELPEKQIDLNLNNSEFGLYPNDPDEVNYCNLTGQPLSQEEGVHLCEGDGTYYKEEVISNLFSEHELEQLYNMDLMYYTDNYYDFSNDEAVLVPDIPKSIAPRETPEELRNAFKESIYNEYANEVVGLSTNGNLKEPMIEIAEPVSSFKKGEYFTASELKKVVQNDLEKDPELANSPLAFYVKTDSEFELEPKGAVTKTTFKNSTGIIEKEESALEEKNKPVTVKADLENER